MARTRARGKLARWSALLAAYAFVLNALLATTLLAATPPGKSLSGYELCAAADTAAALASHEDKATKRAAIHSKICLQQAASASLPHPDAPVVPGIAATAVFAASPCEDHPPRMHRGGSSPRGPPSPT